MAFFWIFVVLRLGVGGGIVPAASGAGVPPQDPQRRSSWVQSPRPYEMPRRPSEGAAGLTTRFGGTPNNFVTPTRFFGKGTRAWRIIKWRLYIFWSLEMIFDHCGHNHLHLKQYKARYVLLLSRNTYAYLYTYSIFHIPHLICSPHRP